MNKQQIVEVSLTKAGHIKIKSPLPILPVSIVEEIVNEVQQTTLKHVAKISDAKEMAAVIFARNTWKWICFIQLGLFVVYELLVK